jgi:hypothetical protein
LEKGFSVFVPCSVFHSKRTHFVMSELCENLTGPKWKKWAAEVSEIRKGFDKTYTSPKRLEKHIRQGVYRRQHLAAAMQHMESLGAGYQQLLNLWHHARREGLARNKDLIYLIDQCQRLESLIHKGLEKGTIPTAAKASWDAEKWIAAGRPYAWARTRYRNEVRNFLYAEQDGKCKLCGCPMVNTSTSSHIDHEHASDRVRGLVHPACNYLIGAAEGSSDLPSAVSNLEGYLRGQSEETNRQI